MREDYSADAHCRRMGLAGLVEPSWTSLGTEPGGLAFRVLLWPAFDDAVCLTVTAGAGEAGARVAVVTLKWAYWPGDVTPHFLCARETVTIDRAAAERSLADLALAQAESLLPDPWHYRDGLGIEAAWVAEGQVVRPDWMHAGREAAEAFAARLISVVHSVSASLTVYRVLARTGDYAGLKLDRAFEPPTMIALIGDSGDKVGINEAVADLEGRRPGRPGYRQYIEQTKKAGPPPSLEPPDPAYPRRQRRHHRK